MLREPFELKLCKELHATLLEKPIDAEAVGHRSPVCAKPSEFRKIGTPRLSSRRTWRDRKHAPAGNEASLSERKLGLESFLSTSLLDSVDPETP